MRHTLKAIFDKRIDAQRLLDRLLASGYTHADSAAAESEHHEGLGASVRHTFARMFGTKPHDEPAPPQDDPSAQHVVVFTSESEPETRRAAGIIDEHGPDEVVEHHERSDPDTAGTFVPGVAAIRTVYPPGTRPGSLQFRGPEDSPYFGTQDAQGRPAGNTFQDRIGRSPWAVPDEEEEAAYRYGENMRASEPSEARSWEEAEPGLQSDWEDKQAHAELPAWHRIKEAVRRGWDRVRH